MKWPLATAGRDMKTSEHSGQRDMKRPLATAGRDMKTSEHSGQRDTKRPLALSRQRDMKGHLNTAGRYENRNTTADGETWIDPLQQQVGRPQNTAEKHEKYLTTADR